MYYVELCWLIRRAANRCTIDGYLIFCHNYVLLCIRVLSGIQNSVLRKQQCRSENILRKSNTILVLALVVAKSSRHSLTTGLRRDYTTCHSYKFLGFRFSFMWTHHCVLLVSVLTWGVNYSCIFDLDLIRCIILYLIPWDAIPSINLCQFWPGITVRTDVKFWN